MTETRDLAMGARRIVVKVGTRLLTSATGKLNLDYIERLVGELASLKNEGHEVIIVSSGAIGAGMGRMAFSGRPGTIPQKQALAAIGQGLLMQLYERYFTGHGQVTAQILLTRSDLSDRRRYINASNTILTLLRWGVVPVINENDTVSVEEIRFGDNDRLSALVAGLCDAHLLVILTTTDGLYDANPDISPEARLVPVVDEITPEVKSWGRETTDDLATGGMITKLNAASITMNTGVGMFIVNGMEPGVLKRLVTGEHIGTYFPPKTHINRRKRWLAYGRLVRGSVTVDVGARDALCHDGKSLLPVGVVGVDGSFEKGELIALLDGSGTEIGRGLCNFSSRELAAVKQRPSSEIKRLIGRSCSEEVIHRDNMVIYEN